MKNSQKKNYIFTEIYSPSVRESTFGRSAFQNIFTLPYPVSQQLLATSHSLFLYSHIFQYFVAKQMFRQKHHLGISFDKVIQYLIPFLYRSKEFLWTINLPKFFNALGGLEACIWCVQTPRTENQILSYVNNTLQQRRSTLSTV